MNTTRVDTSLLLIGKISDWLMRSALTGLDLEGLVRGFCERLAASGMPIARINLTFSMLHPLYRAMGFTWRKGHGLEVEKYNHITEGTGERFKQSPYYYLLQNDLDNLRRRTDTSEKLEFQILEDLRLQGITDYLAFIYSFGGPGARSGEDLGRGMMGSWSTDRADGFDETHLEALLMLQGNLAVATKMAMQDKLAENVLSTYLGQDAGMRILSGQVKRGDGETIRAAVIMGDLRNSTRIADTQGRQVYIDTLNQFFDALAAPFARNGGQILGFLGDGFLAIFPCGRNHAETEAACRAAFAAAGVGMARMQGLNRSRAAQGLDELGYGIGLHVGNVMLGNVGLSDRLTNSAFGAAVNEAERLEQLSKKYGRPLVASEEFVNYVGGGRAAWTLLGQEQLRGLSEPATVYTVGDLPAEAASADLGSDDQTHAPANALSQAELVVLSHRQAKTADGARGKV